MRLGVIGFGNMGSSFVKGALASGLFKPKDVMVMDLDGGRMEAARRGGLMTVDSLRGLSSCDAIILSVKPKDFSKLLKQIGTTLDVRGPLFISIAAGLKLNDLEEDLGIGARIVRAMPNIAASVYEAASVYVLNRHSTAKDRDFVQRLFAGVGKAFELKDEAMLDAVTGVSGSGPAYFFLMMEAMESAGVK
jgi:pyrroline-5-carboxylate reductase